MKNWHFIKAKKKKRVIRERIKKPDIFYILIAKIINLDLNNIF